MVVPKVLPGEHERAQPFWQAANDGVLVVQRCSRCGSYAHPPRRVCVTCRASDGELSMEPVSGRGTIASWVLAERAFLDVHRDDVPYVVVSVALDEQPDVRLLGTLVDGPEAPLSLHAPVEVVFVEAAPGVNVPQWRLVTT